MLVIFFFFWRDADGTESVLVTLFVGVCSNVLIVGFRCGGVIGLGESGDGTGDESQI